MVSISESEQAKRQAESLIGSVFGDRYLVQEIIGQGGMGVVYKAQHMHMKRTVALKMLLPGVIVSDYKLKRFQQESRAASNLSHPNIVTTFDFGISDGQAFLVMDYVEGLPLSDELKDCGRMSQERCLRIFTKVCEALAHAHKKGVIHRDIKDSNIMLVQDDEEIDAVKLVDFGLAKVLSGDDDENMSLTATGAILGSPLYMSPEQCRGLDCDARSDVYSLGCVMYRCLTGKPPFTGRSALDILHMHLTNLPAAMKEVFPQIVVSPEMEKVVARCMSKEPGDRYQTVNEMLQELRAVPSAGSLTEPIATIAPPAVSLNSWPGGSLSMGPSDSGTGPRRQSLREAMMMQQPEADTAPAPFNQAIVLASVAAVLIIGITCGIVIASLPKNKAEPPVVQTTVVQTTVAAPATTTPAPKAAIVEHEHHTDGPKPPPLPAAVPKPGSSAAPPPPVVAAQVIAAAASAPPPFIAAQQAAFDPKRQELFNQLAALEQANGSPRKLLTVLIELTRSHQRTGEDAQSRTWYQRSMSIYQENFQRFKGDMALRNYMADLSRTFNDYEMSAKINKGTLGAEPVAAARPMLGNPPPAPTTPSLGDGPQTGWRQPPGGGQQGGWGQGQPRPPAGGQQGGRGGPPAGFPADAPPVPEGAPQPPYPGWHPGMPENPGGRGANGQGGEF